MKLQFYILSFLILCSFSLRADQYASVNLKTADSTLSILKGQKEVLLYCACCDDDVKRWVTLTRSWKKETGGGDYAIYVEGKTREGKAVNEDIDLAYVYVNINGTGFCLAEQVGLNSYPCMLPFNWATGKPIVEKFGSLGINTEMVDRFDYALDSLRMEIRENYPVMMEGKDAGGKMFLVKQGDIAIDYDALTLTFIFGLEKGYMQKIVVPIGTTGKAEYADEQLLIHCAKGKQIWFEQYVNGKLNYRIAYQHYSIFLNGDASPRAAGMINTIFSTFTKVDAPANVKVSESVMKTVSVSTPKEFINAIGSNKLILMKAGVYNLTSVAGQETSEVSWKEETDGLEILISNVTNMTIEGTDSVTILVEPRYAWVLSFTKCSAIKLEHLVIGHTEAGYCSGGVVHFDHGSDITIDNCTLFGCGTEGLGLEFVKGFSFRKSTIKKCTYDLMTLNGCSDILFEDAIFRNTKEFDMVTLVDCNRITFSRCVFRNNSNGEFMPYLFNIDETSEGIVVMNCTIADNDCHKFTTRRDAMKLAGNKFSGNNFLDFTDAALSKAAD
jgi:hypothetical protein